MSCDIVMCNPAKPIMMEHCDGIPRMNRAHRMKLRIPLAAINIVIVPFLSGDWVGHVQNHVLFLDNSTLMMDFAAPLKY